MDFRKNRTDPSYYSRSVCSQRAFVPLFRNDYDRESHRKRRTRLRKDITESQSDADGLF